MKKRLVLAFMAFVCAFPSFAQNGEGEVPVFSFGLGLGVEGVFNEEYVPGGTEPELVFYQKAGVHPEFKSEKFELALDIAARFRFDGGDEGDEFEVRNEDWEFEGAWEFVNLYLPKIRSLRYGAKGDPFAATLGDIDGITLGNGFIVSSYTNGLFQPENRLLGAVFDIDGGIVDIPYFGLEIFTANAARFDLLAGRMHVKPLAAFEDSILRDLQVGGTVALDRDPFYFAHSYAMYRNAFLALDDDELVSAFGLDFSVPLLTDPAFSLTLFGDRASQNNRVGWMGGVSGRFLRVITYEGQYRVLDDDFLPGYFDASYDLYRPEKYAVFRAGKSEDNTLVEYAGAYLGSLGLSVFDDTIVLKLVSEGPAWNAEGRLYDWQGILMLREGLLPYFSFDILYDKNNMADFGDFMAWKQDSLVRARFHYHTGPAVLSLVYILRYIPTDTGSDRQVLTGIEGRIRLY
jgi:hypothetical protein